MLGHCVRKTAAIYSNYRIIVVVFTFKYESISPVLTMSGGRSNHIENAEQKNNNNNFIPRKHNKVIKDDFQFLQGGII